MFIFNEFEYYDLIETIVAYDNESFIESIKKIETLKEKYYLLGYISYRAKEVFLNKQIKTKTPLICFSAFKKRKPFNYKEKSVELYIKENITFNKYSKAIKEIKELIAKGATYEVNYTFSNDILTSTDGLSLYLSLLKNQKTPYNAYIKDDFKEILSYSPELFFKIKDNKIITKPMKGTIKRQGDDKKEIEFLKNDIKNKAENTMIVDLLRNDLSRIKASYDIKVENLFEVETHKTLHQMTSTISAKLKEIDLYDILSCLFPCGSITGAPKVSTMEIIDNIENYSRDIYCGAIGIISKEEIILSVPIRILERNLEDNKFKFCQGGAIVWKSDTKDEWEECKTKRLFLGESINFNLIETFLLKDLNEHLKRLQKSAKDLGFKFNKNLYFENYKKDKINRIVLSKDGKYEIQYKDLINSKTNKIIVSDKKMYSKNPFLYYKTDFRPWYNLKKEDVFDIIFTNEKDELTEGTRTNILLQIDDVLYTPALKCGLLGGIKRQEMLKKGLIKERVLYLKDLKKAQKIFLINSIRGVVEVEL